MGTGCRIGEAIGLTWSDINLDKRIITINHTLKYYGRKGFGAVTPKTAAGVRTIPMMKSVYNILSEEYRLQQENGGCNLVVDGLKGFIFMNPHGGLYKSETVNEAIKRHTWLTMKKKWQRHYQRTVSRCCYHISQRIT